ncbi:MAG: DNRLRE domain-containing protein [Bacteroidales bacterium]|nr:DNRLRE domain-containing protein [Bacteroidales bacterium]
MRTFYITIAAVLFGLSFTNAQTTVYPTDDMTTQTGNSGMMPTDEELWIANWDAMQNYHQTLIKFDLSQYTGQTITSAKLKVYQFFHAPDGSPTSSKIFAVTEDWDETTWPASSNVAHGTTEYATPEFTSTLGWYEIDISSLVNEWLSETISNYGLVIIADSNTKFAEFYSKDAANYHPYLEIEGITGVNYVNTTADFIVFPNPVNQSATINFNLQANKKVEISIYNSIGSKVKSICNKNFTAGKNSITFTRENLSTGMYFIRIQTNNSIVSRKIIIK